MRKLTLTTETLTELTSDDLAAAAGGLQNYPTQYCTPQPTLPLLQCINNKVTTGVGFQLPTLNGCLTGTETMDCTR